MSKYLNREILLTVFALLIVGLSGIVIAGNIDVEDAPEVSPYTLSDIYSKLTIPDYSPSDHYLYPATSTDQNTMYSIDQIYEAIPERQSLDNSTTTVPSGLYDGIAYDAVDEDIVSENIKYGATIFGVSGTYFCEP